MKIFILALLILNTSFSFAGWDADFAKLKNRPRSYTDSGAICEELARLQLEREYNNSRYQIEVGISYGNLQKTIGELDVVVFDRLKKNVIQIAEVKCWHDLKGGLKKAREQRLRFLTQIQAQRNLYFQSVLNEVDYDPQMFIGVSSFITIGQKGALKSGYDKELEYELREMSKLSLEMINCQDRGHCVRPD